LNAAEDGQEGLASPRPMPCAGAGGHREKVEAFCPRVTEIPFDAEEPFVVFVNGAPDLLLERCTRLQMRGRVEELGAEDRRNILDVNASLASRALRMLGAASRSLAELPRQPAPDEVETGLTFLGLIAMADPARPQAADAIAVAHRAGLKVIMVTDDYFASIVSAVEQGRAIFSNIRTFVYFLTSCNVGEIGTILLGTLLGWPMPLTAIQLLGMNLVTDGAPALSLGLEKGEPAVLILAVVYIPGLNTVFNAVPLSLLQWAYLAPLLFLPGVVDELTKLLQRTMERRGA